MRSGIQDSGRRWKFLLPPNSCRCASQPDAGLHEIWHYVKENEFPTQPFRHTAWATDANWWPTFNAGSTASCLCYLRPAALAGLARTWLAGAHAGADPEAKAAGGRDSVAATKAGTPQTPGGAAQAIANGRTTAAGAGAKTPAAAAQDRARAETPTPSTADPCGQACSSPETRRGRQAKTGAGFNTQGDGQTAA